MYLLRIIAIKILPVKILRFLVILKNHGIHGLIIAFKEMDKEQKITHAMKKAWRKRHTFFLDPLAFGMSPFEYKRQKNTKSESIKFSILVPLYNTSKSFLQEMIGSVLFQTYTNWELCLADGSDSDHFYVREICEEISKQDNRIKYKKLTVNGGISENTNECIKMSSGNYISLLDHDDLLHPSALYETCKAINEKKAEFVYTDEATFESPNLHKIIQTNFKPDFSPDSFNGQNYICHFSTFKKELLTKTGYFDSECNGAQDFDMFLRLSEKTTNIIHVPKCLYYWRSSSNSTAGNLKAKSYTTDAGQKALQKHFLRTGIHADVNNQKIQNVYRIKYQIRNSPLISIIIPNYDHWMVLKRCIDSILNLSTYKNIEIIIIENNSKQKDTFEYYNTLRNIKCIKIIEWKGEFNYSAINNYGVTFALGEYILLLNNDVEVITSEWIEEMLMYAQRKDVGAVGAMLYYPNNKIQHAGVVLGMGGVAGHFQKNYKRGSIGYARRLITVQNYSCVTAACLMVSKNKYNEVGGLEESFKVTFNDIDFCMKLRKAGYLNIWTPFAELYHYESKSRGNDYTQKKYERFVNEIIHFKDKWNIEMNDGDPYFNPNLSLNTTNAFIKGEFFPTR